MTEVRALARVYRSQIRIGLIGEFQYRFGLMVWILGMAVEPVVYLVVWRTVAEARGGAVGGYDAGGFAAYYLLWIVVRVMNIALTPWAFEDRVQRGTLSPLLLAPLHPFHRDLADFIAMKIISLAVMTPIVLLLAIAFQPKAEMSAGSMFLFAIAIWTGFLMRFILVWALGLVTFWIVRVSAIFDLYFALELVLSGRLVPMSLLPPTLRDAAYLLPFHWSFGFPIEVALGRLAPVDIAGGFAMQLLWGVIGAIVLRLMWQRGIRRYGAVGA